MITLEQLNKIDERYPKEKAYQILAGPALTLAEFDSGNRVNMFTTHLEHAVPLDNPDSPAMSTGFEKSFGKYTDSYKVADADYLVVAIIIKNEIMGRFNYIYVVQNIKTKVYDIIEVSHYECLSESHGYLRPYTESDKYVVGNIIKRGTILYKSNNHDEYENYSYGNNANCCYISIPENEEDACVVSDEYCERTTWHKFDKIPITLQKNQVLLNIYGDEYSYLCFPDIGKPIKDGILYARRTINYANAAAELTDGALRTIVSDDEVCAGNGYVADIDIWVNDRNEFTDSGNKTQIYKYYMLQLEYYTKINKLLNPIINARKGDVVQYTHRLRSLYEQSRNYLDINIQWQNNNNNFDFAYIVITTYEQKKLDAGYKITDRHGGKCIVSDVWPKERMPKDKYGRTADIIFSPPGTTARANPGQLYEVEYNFASDIIRMRLQKIPILSKKADLLVDFISTVNPDEGKELSNYMSKMQVNSLIEFFNDIDKNGIFIVQPPFSGNISINNLEKVYKKFNITPQPITFQQEFRDTTTGILLENKKVPILKNDISIDGGEAKEWEQFNPGSVKTIDGKPLGIVTPFDFKDGEKTAENPYIVVPDLNKKGDYYLYNKNLLAFENKSKNKDSPSFTPVRAFLNNKNFLIREYQSERPIIIGKKYIMVLKQNPDDKFSVRSLGSTNQVGIPNKPGKQINLMSPYSKPSIRNGEMENDNLFTRIPPELVHRYMATHSINPAMIEAMAKMLLTKDPLKFHNLPIKSEDIKDDAPALMFHAILFSIGTQIKPIYKDGKNGKAS
jgi:hypothetical protein